MANGCDDRRGGRHRRGEHSTGYHQPAAHELPPGRPPARWITPTSAGAVLVVQRGPTEGQRFELSQQQPVVLGRGNECTIVLPHPTVSRHHAEIRYDNDRFIVNDLGSLNGTYRNRDAVEAAVLADSDLLTIGIFRLLFHLEPPS